MFEQRQAKERQQELWVVAGELPAATPYAFYKRGNRTLQAMDRVLLCALQRHGLLKGRKTGIDSSIIEANASLRGLEHRNTEENYWEYFKRLAAEAGIDPQDTKAVRRFDKKRKGRKTSNDDWQNPHDPAAKVGRTKDGACDMVYKPEHISDLESGAIIHAEVRPGDAADNDATLKARLLAARSTLRKVLPKAQRARAMSEVCADEGYFATEQMAKLHSAKVRTIIGDPQQGRRRKEKQSKRQKLALHRAICAVRSKSGKALSGKRGEHLERGFCHVLGHGGLRRATLRGTEKLSKRLLIAALTHNLSLLLRKQTGIGTAKQALAAAAGLFFAMCKALQAAWSSLQEPQGAGRPIGHQQHPGHEENSIPFFGLFIPSFSTGC